MKITTIKSKTPKKMRRRSNMVQIRKNLASNAIINSSTNGYGNSKHYIAIHETDNNSYGASADAHSRLQANGNSRQASWHYQVDSKEIIQSFDDNIKCWHAGTGEGNNKAISIEICVNPDSDYATAVKKTAELVTHLMSKYNIPKSRVVQHNYFSGKNCPRHLRAGSRGITWTQFINMIGASNNSTPSKPTQPNVKGGKTISQLANEVMLGRWGNGQDRINKLKAAGYNPVAVQAEVDKIKGNKPTLKPVSTVAREVIQGKWGNGQDRINKLKSAGYNPNVVQAEVNRLL